MAEFTGERVIPGQVDLDLWNEHYARYLFATRLCRGKRVLDLGCGCGYGSALLAEAAARVTGIDSAPEAIAYARLSEVCRKNELPYFFPHYLGEKCPLFDYLFDLVDAGSARAGAGVG